eukprot:scaffold98643_cov56-Phaeocystis_antarctica.AAC.2
MSDALREAVRGLHVADPGLGFKPLLAKLREQQPDLGAVSKEVRQALTALKESEAKAAAAALAQAVTSTALTAADGDEDEAWKNCGRAFNLKAFFFRAESAPAKAAAAPRRPLPPPAPLPVALSLACIGCARLPSDMEDEREKHPICDMCRDEKLPTTYQCGVNCPAGPGAALGSCTGLTQQKQRERAEKQTRIAAETGDEYLELMAEGMRYAAKEDWRKAAKAYREAIPLSPFDPTTYFNLGAVLSNSRHVVEAAQRFLEAKERSPVGSEGWAMATASGFEMLTHKACAEVAKPEWWNDEGLMALSLKVVRAVPSEVATNIMRAVVLCGWGGDAWQGGRSRSAAELLKAATHYDRAAALCPAPAVKADFIEQAEECRDASQAKAHESSLRLLLAMVSETPPKGKKET